MELFLTALGLVLVIEGLLYALVPGQLKGMMARLMSVPEDQLRLAGLVAASVGVAFVWIVRWMT
jgi:uncharacterized protein